MNKQFLMQDFIWKTIMNNLIKGKKFEWETIIGLEIHAPS